MISSQRFTSKVPRRVITSICAHAQRKQHLWFSLTSPFEQLRMFLVVVPGFVCDSDAEIIVNHETKTNLPLRIPAYVCSVQNLELFAHNSDVWFNTLPKYLKPNKQCLTENQQTKQQRLRAFVRDQKLKSEKSVRILIRGFIVEIAFGKKLSVFTFS